MRLNRVFISFKDTFVLMFNGSYRYTFLSRTLGKQKEWSENKVNGPRLEKTCLRGAGNKLGVTRAK